MQQQKKGENGTQKGIKADRKKKGWWGGEGSSKWERREGRGKGMGGKKTKKEMDPGPSGESWKEGRRRGY